VRRVLLAVALAACSSPPPAGLRGTTEAVAVPSRGGKAFAPVELRWAPAASAEGELSRPGRALARDPVDACARAKTIAFEAAEVACTARTRRLVATDVVSGACDCARGGCATIVHAACSTSLAESATFGAGVSPLEAVAHALAVSRAESRCTRRLDDVLDLRVVCLRGAALHGCLATARCTMRGEEGTR
jgi:hypothetical protein